MENLSLHDFALTDTLRLSVYPRILTGVMSDSSNIVSEESHKNSLKIKDEEAEDLVKFIDLALRHEHSLDKSAQKAILTRAVTLWTHRRLKNLDYLLILSYLAGRRYGELPFIRLQNGLITQLLFL